MRFKKGTTSQEAFDVIIYDLECLELTDDKDNEYHYQMLKGNLQDIFGRKKTTADKEAEK